LILRPNTTDGAAGCVVGTYFRNPTSEFRTDGLDQIALILDGHGVVDTQQYLASGNEAARLRAGATAPDDRQVNANRLEPLFLVLIESSAQAHEQNDGSYAPDDPEHSKKAAHLVHKDGAERLSKKFAEVHLSG
jgi:hypothetical protein